MGRAETSAGSPRRRIAWVLAVAVLAVAAGFLARRLVEPVGSLARGGFEMPGAAGSPPSHLHFELDGLDGETVTADDFSGRVVVVDFWATWCGPCRVQEEILADLHDRYGSATVSFLAINVGEPESLVREFVEGDPFSYPVLLDPSQTLSARYGIHALPTVMVLDREQRILFQNMGISSARQVDAAIERALGSG